MRARVVDKDRGYRAVIGRVADMKRAPIVSVGIFAAKGAQAKRGHDGKSEALSLIEVALVHEFGLGDAPERSFIRGWVDENLQAIKAQLKHLHQRVLRLELTERQALGQFGAWAAAGIQKRIKSGIEPALDPETVARKGSSTPLIDTGQLWSSIAYAVEGGIF